MTYTIYPNNNKKKKVKIAKQILDFYTSYRKPYVSVVSTLPS